MGDLPVIVLLLLAGTFLLSSASGVAAMDRSEATRLPEYRIVYTQRELLDHDYIIQWWQHVNDLFHRTATLRFPDDRTVHLDVTYQGYEYHRALEAMEGYEARRSPEEVARNFRHHFRADALVFNIAAYVEDAAQGALNVPMLKKIWMVVDGRRVLAHKLQVTSRGKLGQSISVEATFGPLEGKVSDPWVALAFAGGSDASVRGQVLFPVELIELPAMARFSGAPAPSAGKNIAADSAHPRPHSGSARVDASAGGEEEVAYVPLARLQGAAPRRAAAHIRASLEPDPKYTYQELHDREYIDGWWGRLQEKSSQHYGSISTVGSGALLDVAFESKAFVRAMCAAEGFAERLTQADIVDNYRRRFRSGEMRFLVRMTNVLWPSRTFYLKPLVDDIRVSVDGRPKYAPIRVDPADVDVLKRDLTVEVVFRRPIRNPEREILLTFRNLPTVDKEARIRFPAGLFGR